MARQNYRGQSQLVTPAVAQNLTGVAVRLNGTFAGPLSHGYSTTEDGGRVTFNGETHVVGFEGASNFSVSAAGEITYELHRNGTLIPGAFTPVDIVASDKKGNIAITSNLDIPVEDGDYFEVFAKSVPDNIEITLATHGTTHREIR